MNPMMKIAKCFGAVMLVALSGCESMSVSECKVADWSRVGYTDGAAGAPESRLADYTEDCGKTGIVPNARAYRQGWDNGIQRYCTAANGWREGVQGRSGKDAVCQGQPGYRGFSRYLESGLQVYRTQEHIKRNSSEISRLEKDLSNATKDDDKKRLRESLRDLDRSQSRLRHVLAEQQQMAP
ncbi:MAG: hypothetical protein CFE43_12635 [Burkholderiales bacterium PBB3]|nr:MAG: hypothetical protein CFE43_12635 [Burkholderiales bacterium PBB3]